MTLLSTASVGLIGTWLGSLYDACPFVVMPSSAFLTRPARWLWALHEHRGTVSAAPNFAYELCASRVDEAQLAGLDLSSWRLAFDGSEPVSAGTIERFTRRFAGHGFQPTALTPVYGLAESSLGVTFPPAGRGPRLERVERESFARDGRAIPTDAPGLTFVSSGLPLPGHEVRVIDAQSHELPERTEGRIQFRGPSATSGYRNNPEATRARTVLRGDQWFPRHGAVQATVLPSLTSRGDTWEAAVQVMRRGFEALHHYLEHTSVTGDVARSVPPARQGLRR